MKRIEDLNNKDDVTNLTNDEMYDIYEQSKWVNFNNREVYLSFTNECGVRGILT